MTEQRLSIWLSEQEQKEIQKFRKEAEKEKRSLSNYCKRRLFNYEKKEYGKKNKTR